jgi:hypothetical protein
VEVAKSNDYFTTRTNVGGNISTSSNQRSVAVDPNSVLDRAIEVGTYRTRISYNNSAWSYSALDLPAGNESEYVEVYWHPNESGTVFVSNFGFDAIEGTGTWVSTNNGTNWTNINNNLGSYTDSFLVRYDFFNENIYINTYGSYVGAVPCATETVIDTTPPIVNMISLSFRTSSTTPTISFNFTDILSSTASCTLYYLKIS